ncbi:glycosyltransferase [Xenorhabdus entomophaga]|uniref:glycosyltransferase n=1 Tax=Xenorhabdus entomophaga TaxID=3136257 RepID=UPI0030F3A46D
MNIPKKIHYFWSGNNIPETNLRNMIEVKSANPGFEVNIWGEKNVQSLIVSTLRKIKLKYQDTDFDLGEIPVNFNYRNIETTFRFLRQQAFYLNSIQDPMLNCLSYFNKRKKDADNARRYGDYVDLINYLQHIYHLNLMGNYHNYATSSDLARLTILYMEGGIYLDADVELYDSDIKNTLDRKKAKFEDLQLRSSIGLGDNSGLGWSATPYTRFGNAIIASLPQSKEIFNLLLKIAIMIKKHHLSIQMYESPKADEISQIKRFNKYHEVDKRVDLALKLKKTHQINLDTRCGIQDPVWRTGIDPDDANDKFSRELRRIDYTVKMTGPTFIDNYLNPGLGINFPKKYQLKSKIKNDRVFKNVNDEGDWSNLKKKKYADEDPFS